MRKIIYTILIAAFLLAGTQAGASHRDAIGIRIMLNSEHLPVSVWYEQQEFEGKTQSMLVDGYEAIKEGSTVYINAINIADPEKKEEKDNLYTNIYIISYNDKGSNDTENIFNQIIKNWKFNTNIKDVKVKAALRREAKRMADLAKIKLVLEKYKIAYGHYPKLEAGSYIKGQTMSTWSSWQDVLGKSLGIKLPVDPVNKLGDCADTHPDCYCPVGYKDDTCWDNVNRKFSTADSISAGLEAIKEKNQKPLVYYYETTDGQSYEITTSGYETDYLDDTGITNEITDELKAPEIQPINEDNLLKMKFGSILEMDIRAYDENKNEKLVWDSPIIAEGNCFGGIPALDYSPRIDAWVEENSRYESFRNITIKSKDLRADCEGAIKIQVKDKDNLQDDYEFKVSVKNYLPETIYLSNDKGVAGYPFDSEIIVDEFLKGTLEFSWMGNTPSGLILDKDTGKITGTVEAANTYSFSITAKDTTSASSLNYNAEIEIINKAPRIDCLDEDEVTAGADWSLDINANDNAPYDEIDGKAYPHLPLSFSIPGININQETIDEMAGIFKISTKAPGVGEYTFNIAIRDAKGAETQKLFTLTVNNHDPVITDWPEAGEPMGINDKFEYPVIAEDKDGHKITYSLSGIPNTTLYIHSGTGEIYTPGGAFGAGDYGEYTVKVTASDGYGGADEKYFTLIIKTLCGNGEKEKSETIEEDCDYKVNNNCCVDCSWTCPPYEDKLIVENDESKAITIQNSGDNLSLNLPACREAESLKIDAKIEEEVVGSSEGVDIIFVTDTSGSMPDDFSVVKTPLKDAINILHNSDQADKIRVGLVQFAGSGVRSSVSLSSISSEVHLKILKDSINLYDDAGGTPMLAGINKAEEIFKKFYIADSKKIIILLADGSPDSYQNPNDKLNILKNDYGLIVYTIAFTGPDAEGLQKNMCVWSSDDPPTIVRNSDGIEELIGNYDSCYCDWASDDSLQCPREQYSYKGTKTSNLTNIYASITSNIEKRLTPQDISIEGTVQNLQADANGYIYNIDLIDGAQCDNKEHEEKFKINYAGGGSVKFFNARVKYCPACEVN